MSELQLQFSAATLTLTCTILDGVVAERNGCYTGCACCQADFTHVTTPMMTQLFAHTFVRRR